VHGRFSREAIAAQRRVNWETVEQGVARILREERRAERNRARQVEDCRVRSIGCWRYPMTGDAELIESGRISTGP
jgi:hypothetical protein